MTLVATGGIIEWPTPLLQPGPTATALGMQNHTLDSTTDALAWVGKAWFTDSIAVIYFRTGTIPVGGGDTVDVRIETVVNGRPSGTLWAANTNVTVAIADSDDSVWKTATLTTAASLVPSDEFAIVIISSAGTPSIVLTGNGMGQQDSSNWRDHYPLLLQNATGAYAAPVNASCFEWIVQLTNSGIIPFLSLVPTDGPGALTAINSGTSPDELALRFQSPFKCRCIGMRVALFNIAAGADITMSLWPASSTTDADALGQVSQDGDFALSTTQDGYCRFMFDAAVTLEIGTTYYAGVRGDTANSASVGEASVPAGIANAMRAFPIPATGEVYRASRTWTAGSAGAWATVTTTLPLISLIIDQVDDGESAGGGGGLRLAGTGGLAA